MKMEKNMIPKWLERVLLGVGVCALVIAGFILVVKVYQAFTSPSGELYKWSIGIFVLLFISIILISAIFSWIRRREGELSVKTGTSASVKSPVSSLQSDSSSQFGKLYK